MVDMEALTRAFEDAYYGEIGQVQCVPERGVAAVVAVVKVTEARRRAMLADRWRSRAAGLLAKSAAGQTENADSSEAGEREAWVAEAGVLATCARELLPSLPQ